MEGMRRGGGWIERGDEVRRGSWVDRGGEEGWWIEVT